MRLLSKSGVAGELRYFGPSGSAAGAGDGAAVGDAGRTPPPEAGGVARGVPDREEDAAAEAIVDAAAAPAGRGQAHLDELGRADLALALQRADQGVPVGWREPELGSLDRFVGEAAAVEVGQRGGAGLAAHEDRVVEGERRVEHLVETLAVGILARCPLVDLHPGTLRQAPERLGEGDPVPAHHEREDVPALAAAEAVPRLPRGRDDEAGRLLRVERAEALERGAGFPELHGLPDDVDDRELALDFRGDPDGQPAPLPTAPTRPRPLASSARVVHRTRKRACQALTRHERRWSVRPRSTFVKRSVNTPGGYPATRASPARGPAGRMYRTAPRSGACRSTGPLEERRRVPREALVTSAVS